MSNPIIALLLLKDQKEFLEEEHDMTASGYCYKHKSCCRDFNAVNQLKERWPMLNYTVEE